MLIVVRHAEAETRTIGGPSEHERPLTDRGRRQADELVDVLLRYTPVAIVSSPYRRAVDTVTPAAAALGVEVETRADLREWDDGLETTDDRRPLYDRCWRDSDHRFGTGETHAELRARATNSLHELLERASDGAVVAAGHGTWITRGLEGLGIAGGADFWEAIPLPAVYLLTSDGGGVSARGPGLSPA
jgi:2,3-bisphosphoglycerate-dependent phosphoglycerate mutase